MACILGVDSADNAVLMSSFSNYLSDGDRITVERALQGTVEESKKEDLLDLFSRMGSHCLPPEQNTRVAIETMSQSHAARTQIHNRLFYSQPDRCADESTS